MAHPIALNGTSRYEDEMLRCCCRVTPGPDMLARIGQLAKEPLNWSLVFDRSWWHRVRPLTYKHLDALPSGVVPDSVVQGLAEHVAELRERNQRLWRTLNDVAAAAEASPESSSEETAATGSNQAWAMLIKRVYEVDPLSCPECGGQMEVVSFIEPPQADVIEAILKHCGLWQASAPRAPPEMDDLVLELDAAYSGSSLESLDQADQSQELTYVDIDTFLESF